MIKKIAKMDTTQEKQARTYSTTAKNTRPFFEEPEFRKNKQRALKRLSGRAFKMINNDTEHKEYAFDVNDWFYLDYLRSIGCEYTRKFKTDKETNENAVVMRVGNVKLKRRQRKMKNERNQAINAIMRVLVTYFDLKSFHVRLSMTCIAEKAGLLTVSDAGNVSISRCTNPLKDFFVAHNLLKINNGEDATLDGTEGKYNASFITLNYEFFQMLGFSKEEIEKMRQERLTYEKNCPALTKEDIHERSLAYCQRKAYHAWVRTQDDKRREGMKKAKRLARDTKYAERFVRMTHDQQMKYAGAIVVDRLKNIGHDKIGFKENITYKELQEETLIEWGRLKEYYHRLLH